MEQTVIFDEKVALNPIELRKTIVSFDDILLEKLKKTLEGRCSRHGYVIPGSVEILSRSLGVIEKGRFTADILFYLKAQGKVYNPPDGFEVEGEVVRKNKMGLYLIVEDAIRIMVPRDLHIGSEDFESIEMGDRVRVVIRKSRFQVNDTHILSIAQLLGKVGGAPPPARPVPAAPAALAEEEEEEEEEEAEGEAEGAKKGTPDSLPGLEYVGPSLAEQELENVD